MNYYFKENHIKICILIILLIVFSFIISNLTSPEENNHRKNVNKIKCSEDYIKNKTNKLVDENFFIIDSNNLDLISSHMYGYIISRNGILTDNYFQMIGHYEDPEPFGTYIMIRRRNNNIEINQDYYGSYGLYLFENDNKSYFALSNSFLLLVEHLYGKQNLSLNKDFSDNFLVSGLISLSIDETLIKEIKQLPQNALININIKKKIINISYIQRKENSIPLESKEGLEIIDKWFDKWGYILRSLKKKTDNISFDLSGGFDSRLLFSILLNSGININEIIINSRNDKSHIFEEDFKIASNISSNFGFKLNNIKFDENSINWGIKDTLLGLVYTKLGFTKNLNSINTKFYLKPRFSFNGGGGENNRGVPGCKFEKYLNNLATQGKQIEGHQEEFYNASMRLYNRSVEIIKSEKSNINDYEIASFIFQISTNKYHFGKGSLHYFLSNGYSIAPLLDPELNKIKYEISGKSTQDLIAYIFTRFAPKLLLFPFERKRLLSIKSLKKAQILNKLIPKYIIKLDYNNNFYIDTSRISPSPKSNESQNIIDYIIEHLKSYEFKKIFNKVYDKNVYDWVLKYSKNTTKFPTRHLFGLYSIGKIIQYI